MVREEEFQALLSLKRQNTDQKDKMKELKLSLRTAEKESEDLRSHIEKLFSQNYELVRKNKSLQKQCKSLIHERLSLIEKGSLLPSFDDLKIESNFSRSNGRKHPPPKANSTRNKSCLSRLRESKQKAGRPERCALLDKRVAGGVTRKD